MQTNWLYKNSSKLAALSKMTNCAVVKVAQCAAEGTKLLMKKQAWLLQNMIHLNKENNWTCGVLQVQFL